MKKPSRLPAPAPTSAAVVRDIAVKGALGALPGGSVLYDLLQARRKEVAEAIAAEQSRRLDAFYSEMLHAPNTMDESTASAMLDSADFQALLRACVADIEAEKLSLYAVMACSIASGSVPKPSRRHFVLCLRDLSADELALLRGAFVARQHPNMMTAAGSGSIDQREYLDTGEPGDFRAIQVATLLSKGFVHDNKLTALGHAFVKATWRPEHLTPEALGLQTWSGHHVNIINYEIGQGELDLVATRLADGLRAMRSKSSILAVTSENSKRVLLASTAERRLAILLLGKTNDRIASHLDALRTYVSRVPTVAVLVAPDAALPEAISVGGIINAEGLSPQNLLDELAEKLVQAHESLHGAA